MESVFAAKSLDRYKHRYTCTLVVDYLVGGIPSNPKVAEPWIKKNLGADNEDIITELVAKTMIERGIEMAEATDEVIASTKLNGFYRDHNGLYFAGRNVKAAIKESSNICWPKAKWGPTGKGTMGFWSEHVFVPEDHISLGVAEPTDIHQRFVHTWRGSGIQYEEYVELAELTFTVITDADPKIITDDHWAELWSCGEQQGIGSSRGVGYGRYTVVKWDKQQ